MNDPIPGSKEDLQKKRRAQIGPAAALYDPGLPLPAAPDLERCVISCLMQAPEFGVQLIGSKIKLEHFSVEAHRLLWDLTLQQVNEGKPVDPKTMVQLLSDRGLLEKVPHPLVSEIYTSSPNPAAAGYYANIVHQKWREREAMLQAGEFIAKAAVVESEEELDALIGDLDGKLMRIVQDKMHTRTDLRSGEDVAADAMLRFRERHQHRGSILGLQFGFPDLDRRVNGFQKEDFIVVGARPAMGKTSLATSLAENVAILAANKENRPVLMFTLEMSETQIMERSLLGRARIGMKKGRTGFFSEAEASVLYAFEESLKGTRGMPADKRLYDLVQSSLDAYEAYCVKKGKLVGKTAAQLENMRETALAEIKPFAQAVVDTACGQFTFYDGYAVTIQEIRSVMRRWLRKIGWTYDGHRAPPLVVIDYLQLVKASLRKNVGDPRLTSIEVCEALKGFAKETGIVIMGLAQVKVNDKRPDAEPQLSDIKESGAFAEFSDYVFTIHRPCYYKKWEQLSEEAQKNWDEKAKNSARGRQAQEASGLASSFWDGKAYYTGLTTIGIKKGRHCPTDDVYAYFRAGEVRFVPITTDLYSSNTERREKPDNHDD